MWADGPREGRRRTRRWAIRPPVLKRRWLCFALVPVTIAVLSAACAEDDAPGLAPVEDAGTGGSADGAGSDAASTVDAGDAGAPSTCAITRAFVEGCFGPKELNCGPDKYDAWCAKNDATINSAAFRRAEALCLKKANCDADRRRDCECKSYGSAVPTASQTALVAAYCATCEPGDLTGCKARATTYDPVKGPNSVTDLFVAAWELADPLTDAIRTQCTGAAADAGPGDAGDAGDGGDAGDPVAACAKQFGKCAGDVYFAVLPDCP